MKPEFTEFPKMARLSRDIIITEKIDGTNASILITDEGEIFAASRTRWITPEDDNFGFAKWVEDNKQDLFKLGAGRHFGEWYGSGIQRGYGLPKGEKRFALFNVTKWKDNPEKPVCCETVPVLYTGQFNTNVIHDIVHSLSRVGSYAVPGYNNPEGIIIWHTAANIGFKKTIKDDESPKSILTTH